VTSSTSGRAADRAPAGLGRAARTKDSASGAGQPGFVAPVAEPGPISSSPPSVTGASKTAVPGPGIRRRDVTTPGPGRTGSPAGGEPGSAGVPPDRSERTFTIALPAGLKLLSLNDRLHFAERYRRSEALKKAAWAVAIHRKVPRLERVSVVVEYQPRDRRERDADNISPSGKAALDGIVAAKVLADDSKTYVTGVRCTIGEPYPLGRLVLHLTEVAAAGRGA
jgi:crossover junction endodeoxyribonuclease RusA